MVADVVVSSMKPFPDATSLALISDLQFNEPYSSAALNRKLRGIVNTGLYGGFTPSPAGGLNLKISSGKEGGTASINIDKYYQLTIRQQADVTMPVTAGKKVIVVLEATYTLGQETYQVNSNSAVKAAEIKFLEEGTALRQNQLELCSVTVPAGATELTEDMIDISHRRNQTIGITLSGEIDSDADHIAASSHAVKKAVKAAHDNAEKKTEELKQSVQSVLDDYHLRISACELHRRVENFHTLTDTCIAELLSFNSPDAFDKSVKLEVNEKLTIDYTGPISGKCNIGTPEHYTLVLCTSTTLEYESARVQLNSDGSFRYNRSWPGAKSFKLVRNTNNGLVTVWEDPICIRSYRMPADAGDE
ncbi:hypothetical protein F8V45_23950, partial [Salmonella enterica]|nr:hypothetical protein [Salmonella enterica]